MAWNAVIFSVVLLNLPDRSLGEKSIPLSISVKNNNYRICSCPHRSRTWIYITNQLFPFTTNGNSVHIRRQRSPPILFQLQHLPNNIPASSSHHAVKATVRRASLTDSNTSTNRIKSLRNSEKLSAFCLRSQACNLKARSHFKKTWTAFSRPL